MVALMHCVGHSRMQTIHPVQYGSTTSESKVKAGKPIYALATGIRLDGSGYWAVTGRLRAVVIVTMRPSMNPSIVN